MKWIESVTVSPHHMEINNISSASAVLRYMQDAAYNHMFNYPPSMDDLKADNKAFLLSKLGMSIYSPLRVNEKLQVKTWACESKGYSFFRCSQILRENEIVAELISIWALVDTENRKLLRISDYEQNYENDELLDLDIPSRLRIPRELELSLAGEYTVSYNDVDSNMHINNTNYPDILCGFLPTMKGRRVVKIAINYLQDAPLGETIKVYASKEDDGSIWFRTIRQDGEINIEAEMVLENL